MSNSYTQSVTTIVLTQSQLETVSDVIAAAKAKVEDMVGDDDLTVDYCVCEVTVDDRCVVISDGDSGSFVPEHAVLVIQHIVDELEIDTPIICQWANTSDKSVADGFGGGAALIRKGYKALFCEPYNILNHVANNEVRNRGSYMEEFVDVYHKVDPHKLRLRAHKYDAKGNGASLHASAAWYGRADALRKIADLLDGGEDAESQEE